MQEKQALLRYSKSSSFYLKTKSDYFWRMKTPKKGKRSNNFYLEQPKRDKCKICDHIIPKSVDFNSHGIDCVFCENCNHLNGVYDDTTAFVEEIYLKSDGVNYRKSIMMRILFKELPTYICQRLII